MIPTKEECLKLMRHRGMLGNIFEHSLIVTKVALSLSEALNKKGQQIDTELVEAASLLHDIAKTECFATQQDHAEAGAGLLEAMGYARVGKVVAQHIRLLKEQGSSRVTEEEVVYYADKRVRHNEIVSLEERFMDLMERYGKDEKAIEQLERLKQAASETERKIFSILEADPEVLQRL